MLGPAPLLRRMEAEAIIERAVPSFPQGIPLWPVGCGARFGDAIDATKSLYYAEFGVKPAITMNTEENPVFITK